MLAEAGTPPRELNGLDIKNRTPMAATWEDGVIRALDRVWPQLDALVVLDQVSEADCGVVTRRVRERLAEKGRGEPGKFVLADSRERIGLFCDVAVKPNRRECQRAVSGAGEIEEAAAELALAPVRFHGHVAEQADALAAV